MRLEIKSVQMKGALIHFVDGKLGLVREKEQGIADDWVVGDRLEVTLAESPVFRLESLDTGDVAHVLLYKDNVQFLQLPDA